MREIPGLGALFWRPLHDKQSGHYNIFALRDKNEGMAALRDIFTNDCDYNLQFVLFSTSGVHGWYCSIEQAERELTDVQAVDVHPPGVTFLIVQPRLVTLRYGNAFPSNADDIAFLKRIRALSHEVIQSIGSDQR